ncbi:helix-turn-helix domain-containing protein [Paenibacillus sp. J31TS4]|uniref:helix-turn-helix domain-containing protein n=1 Tax=Paenibacillus sp. J31TS4 TaxID=2807195 RepID=UPI001BD02311|nr:helix-turn-helix domain-containing protein [Paenibacillus sp. J31TS4]
MLRRRNNVFLTLWLSYLLILLIPVSISVLLYSNAESAMVNNANRSNLAMLEQVRQIMDHQLKEVDRLAVQISSHPKLQTLWNIDDGDRYLLYSEAVKELKSMRNPSGLIENFFVRLDQSDLLLTPDMKTDTNTFFTYIAPYRGMTPEQVKQHFFTGYHFKTFWPSTAILDTVTPKKVITCAVSLPLGEQSNVRATLIIQIGEQQILHLLETIDWAGSGAMYIVDDAKQVIMSTASRPLPADWIDSLTQNEHYETYQENGQDVMLSYTTGESGWKYVSVVPKDVLLKRVNELKGWALTLLIAALLGGTGAAFWMAYRSYSPIRDIVLTLRSGRGAANPTVNAYDFIRSSIEETLAEGKELRRELENHTPVLQAHYLTRLLKGQTEPGGLNGGPSGAIGIRFPHDHICVLLLEVDDYSGFVREDSEEEWALVRFILMNLSSEWIGDDGYVVETDINRLAILLSVPDPSEETKRLRAGRIDELKQLMEKRFHMKVTIAASSIRQGLPEVARCYGEALSALDYRIIHGINSSIYYDELKEIEGAYYHYPMETELQLMGYLKAGKYDSAAELLDSLYEENVVSRGLTPEMGKCLFFDLLSTILKVMNALKIDDSQAAARHELVKQIMNGPSAEDILRRMKELCRLLCSTVVSARDVQSKQLNEDIRLYIRDHIGDNGLGLTAIAEHFQLAPQYVSSFFKKQNGVNLTDYIVEQRVEEAKRYLADPSLTLLQVARNVGYATDIGFIRVFKKMVGMTPGKYREMVTVDG